MYLPLLLLFFAQNSAPPETASLSGTIVNSVTGEPVNRVEIVAEPVGVRAGRIPWAVTNTNGNFTFSRVRPGQYRLRGYRNGYLDTYQGIPITLIAGDEVRGLQFKLVPFGVIAGKVRDSDGEPLTRASVALYRVTYDSGRRRIWGVDGIDDIFTDDFGEYRIAGLPAGKYYVRAAARSQLGPELEYDGRQEILLPSLFPGVQDLNAARPVDLSPGARMTGIDITLPRSKTVRVAGHATPPAGTLLARIYLRSDAGPEAERVEYRVQAVREPNGDFEIRAVPPGAYQLVGVAVSPNPTGNIMFPQREYRSSIPVVVGSSPVEGLRLAIEGRAETTGTVTIDSEGTERKLSGFARIIFDDGINEEIGAQIGQDMNFAAALPKGRFSVSFHAPTDLILRNVMFDGRNVLQDGLIISDASPKRIEIVLAMDGGRIEGVVADHEEKPIVGATVVLVPQPKLRFHTRRFRQVETDQYGKYKIPNVVPGEYSLFSWTGIEQGIWWDPAFLQAHDDKGQAVTVGERGHEKANLRVIAKSLRADP